MWFQVRDLHSYYDKSHVLHGVSMELNPKEIVCLLGRNGVGKTTTLKSIIGIVRPRQGSIRFKGEELMGKQPFQIARMGIGFVPEERRIFGSLTVHENLLIGVRKRPSQVGNNWTIDRVYTAFPMLKMRQDNKGRHLSGGEQQVLTIARTLLGNPELLLVDEPTEGLAPLIAMEVLNILGQIRDSGLTVLMVEQNFRGAIKIASRFYVMSKGQIVYEGDGPSLLQAEHIRSTYLEV